MSCFSGGKHLLPTPFDVIRGKSQPTRSGSGLRKSLVVNFGIETMPSKKSPRADSAKNRRTKSRKHKSNPTPKPDAPSVQRLNKILASAGLGSRREVEELIVQGRVEVDRETITDLSFKADPRTVTIKVDGLVLKRERLVYHALNKPTGVLSTNRDPDGRMRVIDLVPGSERVFSVGRLDRSSEGLMLLTNDGELAQRLAHPKFTVQKTYFVVVSGVMTQDELDKLRKGVHLAEGFARIDGASIRRQRKGCTELEIVLSEGKNREIRRILARAGHKVVVLRRLAIGPLRLGQLPVGASRPLTSTEVKALYAATLQTSAKTKKATRNSPPSSQVQRVAPATDFDDEGDDDDVLGQDFQDVNLDDIDLTSADGDFVGHFSSTRAGAVLGYDDPSPSAATGRQAGKATGKRPSKQKPAKREGQRATSGGKAKTTRSSQVRGAAVPCNGLSSAQRSSRGSDSEGR